MPANPEKPLAGQSVLIHEDEPFFQRMVHSVLSSFGARALRICPREAALPMALDNLRPDVLILGIEPGDPGRLALLRMLAGACQQAGTNCRIVATTACPDARFVRAIADHGAHGVVLKPFSPLTMLRMMQRMRDQREAIRQSRMDDAHDALARPHDSTARFNSR